MNNKTNRLCTLDTYKNNLERAGFLITVDRGMYKRIKKIPPGLSCKICLRIAKGEKIKNLKNICDINYNIQQKKINREKNIKRWNNLINNSFTINERLEAINA
jgi:hypothetical protein